jgi:hypothetical protein
MRSIADNLQAAESLGYACLDYFSLPPSCWWDEYYTPWLRNIERLKEEANQDDYLRSAIADALDEIDLFRRFATEYGYVFYLLQNSKFAIAHIAARDAP